MAAPNQPITKYNELYDLLCNRSWEATRQHSKDIKEKMDAGISDDELQALEIAYRKKWAFMDKMIAGMETQKVSKTTLKDIRAILGDELDQYL